MIRIRKIAIGLSMAIAAANSPAHATIIDFTSTSLGGNQWRYDYVVTNNTLQSAIEEFTIYFDQSLFGLLSAPQAPQGWDPLVLQADVNIPAAGLYDALALNGGIGVGASGGGFSVVVEYFGAGTPGAQHFTVSDPLSFAELDAGQTGDALVPIPLPASTWLLLGAMGAMGAALRRRGGAQ